MLKHPKISLLRSSSKPYERRLPIHPEHLHLISPGLRGYVYIESGYFKDFGYDDSYAKNLGFPVEPRSTLITSADCHWIIRPMPEDLALMKHNTTVVGFFHCVQNQEMAKVAVHNKLTLVGMESLYNKYDEFLFVENSSITGKQAVLHALASANVTANNNLKAVVIGHGNVGYSAITELINLGIVDITCCSKRDAVKILDKIKGIVYKKIKRSSDGLKVEIDDGSPILDILKTADIIINATAQHVYHPEIFLYNTDLKDLKGGALIIDISCDKNMGFEFARINSLANPIIKLENVLYYAVDHLPTLDYDNATKEMSNPLVRIFPIVVEYINMLRKFEIIENAIQIKNGGCINPDIEYFKTHFC